MAMVPAKSQQSLNFSFSFLKWGQRSHVNNSKRCRRLISDTTTTGHRRLSPLTDSRDSSDSDHNNHYQPPCFQKDGETKIDDENDGVLLKRETNSGKLSGDDVVTPAAADGEIKPWNLRPRRPAISDFHKNTDTGRGSGSGVVPAVSNTKSRRLSRGVAAEEIEEEEKKKNKKRKLWISLTKEEIEEDVYALTRSKPARRPKKRNRIIQRQIDNVFPGLYLIGISADNYRV